MPGDNAFSYAVLRLVPRVERGERINVGVVVFCRPLQYLEARTALDEARALVLWPDLDVESVRAHLAAIERVAAGRSRPPARSPGWTRPPASTGSSRRRARSSSRPSCTPGSAARRRTSWTKLFRELVVVA